MKESPSLTYAMQYGKPIAVQLVTCHVYNSRRHDCGAVSKYACGVPSELYNLQPCEYFADEPNKLAAGRC